MRSASRTDSCDSLALCPSRPSPTFDAAVDQSLRIRVSKILEREVRCDSTHPVEGVESLSPTSEMPTGGRDDAVDVRLVSSEPQAFLFALEGIVISARDQMRDGELMKKEMHLRVAR